MNVFKRIVFKLKQDVKFSASNPETFKEVWSFNSNGIRVLSLFILFLVLFSVLVVIIVQSNFVQSYIGGNNVSIERDALEEQNEQIHQLKEKIIAQDDFIENIQLILSGEVPANMHIDSVAIVKDSLKALEFSSEMTEDEKKIAQKVKEDMSTFNENEVSLVTFYVAPVKGVVSQKFNKENHLGIDIVTQKDAVVKACLGGVVIYSGYTSKDGYLLILEHSDFALSVYKHNQRIMKEVGDRVQLGDPIGIVGNTGENSDGPHLHFELWIEQQAVNPEDYIQFTR